MKLNLKNLKIIDISCIKLAVMSATLFLISVWKGFANWAIKTHWAWFLIICLILSIKPIITILEK